MPRERAISENVSVILILFMVLVLAIAIMVLVFGSTLFQQKSAFIAPDIGNQTIDGKNVIRIFHKGGEVTGLKPGTSSFYEMGVYIDTAFGSQRALPVSGVDRFSPGTTLYVFFRPDGRWNITDKTPDLAGAQSLPGGNVRLRLVDEKAGLMIAQWPAIGPSVFPNATLTVLSIAPNNGYIGQSVGITNLTGTGFQPGAAVRLNRTATADIPATNVVVVSSTRMTCNFSLSGAPAGQRNVVVTNPDGISAVLVNGFTVNPALPLATVSSITNITGYRGWTVIERITGTNFVSGSTSKLNRSGAADIPATSCTYISSTRLVCSYDLTGKTASPPNYNVVVTNPDGRSGMRANYFVLSDPPPVVTSITNGTGYRGWPVVERITGSGFISGSVPKLSRTGYPDIPASGFVVISPTQINCLFDLVNKAESPANGYNITVSNPDGRSGTRALFTLSSPAPTVTSITANIGNTTVPVTITNLAGTRFQADTTLVQLVNGTETITATNVVVQANNRITCTFDLSSATKPRYNVTVMNTDGKSGTGRNLFTVRPRLAADFFWVQNTPLNNHRITVTDRSSGGATAYTVIRDWDWGDGTAHGSGSPTAHTYTSGGTKTVTLTITRTADGEKSTRILSFTVT